MSAPWQVDQMLWKCTAHCRCLAQFKSLTAVGGVQNMSTDDFIGQEFDVKVLEANEVRMSPSDVCTLPPCRSSYPPTLCTPLLLRACLSHAADVIHAATSVQSGGPYTNACINWSRCCIQSARMQQLGHAMPALVVVLGNLSSAAQWYHDQLCPCRKAIV